MLKPLCLFVCIWGSLIFLIPGCDDAPKSKKAVKSEAPEATPAHLVLYTSVDPLVVGPIIDTFVDQTKIRVSIVGDKDSQRSYALAKQLREDQHDPKADVWWSGEIFHTILLADEGLLQPYASPSSTDIPANLKDADSCWASVGLRARVLAIRQGVTVADVSNLENLKASEIAGKIAISRPHVGATSGHLAALYVLWDEYRYRIFLQTLRENGVKMLGGNIDVANQVAAGTYDVGLTDSDAVDAALARGEKLIMQYPDQRGAGTLGIPSTVGLVAGSRDIDNAKKLIDYLLSPQVEQVLIEARYASWGVRGDTGKVKLMDIDYKKAARAMPRAVMLAETVLSGKRVVE